MTKIRGGRHGDFYRICDRTGFKIWASDTQKEWTGNIVRETSWEARHPQDFVTGVRDEQAAPDPRPRPADQYVQPTGIATLMVTTAPDGIQSFLVDTSSGEPEVYVYRTYTANPDMVRTAL